MWDDRGLRDDQDHLLRVGVVEQPSAVTSAVTGTAAAERAGKGDEGASFGSVESDMSTSQESHRCHASRFSLQATRWPRMSVCPITGRSLCSLAKVPSAKALHSKVPLPFVGS